MEQLLLFADEPRPPKTRSPPDPQEYKVVALRDCPTPADMHMCDTPEAAVSYWRMHIQPHPWFDSERECLVVLLLNTRRRVKGHQLISTGTLDCLLVHAREVFRAAIVAAALELIKPVSWTLPANWVYPSWPGPCWPPASTSRSSASFPN